MCGIMGSLHYHGRREFSIRPLMALMRHRGPDESHIIEQDFWSLAVTRLAITSPQEKNTQPLWSADKRFCFAFNGEIYNHKELRAFLIKKGYMFKTSSDAEVLFHLYLEYGSQAFVKAQGMFACAIFDCIKKTWTLAKDPFGIKPLYFTLKTGVFVFASEIKPLLKILKNPSLNKSALPSYLQRRFAMGQETLFKSVFRALPGEITTVSPQGEIKSVKYRSLAKRLFHNGENTGAKAKSKRFDEFSARLKKSLHQTAKSDSPLGVLLSGGLDSSVVSRGACDVLAQPPGAYFFDKGCDQQERFFAKALSSATGQTLHTVSPGKSDFLLLPKILRALEEPLGDSIIVPTYKLMKAVSEKNKTALSGEGADEILAGYGHHKIYYLFHKFRFLRTLSAALGARLPSSLLNALFPYPEKLSKQVLSKALGALSQKGLKRFVELSHLFDSEEIQRLIPQMADLKPSLYPDIFSLKDLMIFDAENWLSHYNLLRIDKLSMAFSLEVRLPYLNWDFANFALNLPQSDTISLRSNKNILRRFARQELFKPSNGGDQTRLQTGLKIARRPKRPFTFKESSSYSKEYRGFVRDHLDSSFKKAYDISHKELERLLKIWENGLDKGFESSETAANHTDPTSATILSKAKKGARPDFRTEKQIASLLNLAIWTKEFF